MSSVEVLLGLQECDTESMRLKKQLDELPQAKEIMECRSKRKELKAKQDQVVELSDEVEKKISGFQEEEERIVEKLKDLQDTLDTTHDYRVTQSVTRDMQGLVKRQQTLVEQSDALLERQIKVDKLFNQLRDMLHNLDHREEELTAQFKEAGGMIKQQIDAYSAKRDELLARLDSVTAARYERLRAEKGGFGVAVLVDGTCSVCRSEIMEGNLRRLLAGPDVGECPNCHRMLVVRGPEEEEQ